MWHEAWPGRPQQNLRPKNRKYHFRNRQENAINYFKVHLAWPQNVKALSVFQIHVVHCGG